MKVYQIMQWGKNRSIVKEIFTPTNEIRILILDNDLLINLDEMGLFK